MNLTTDDVINKYSNMVYRLSFSQTKNISDADDIFQEVFLRYIKYNKTFESEEHLKAWLIRVTINCCKKLWHSAWFKRTTSLEDSFTFEIKEENDINYALCKLPVNYRTVIHLFYYEELSVREISEILNIKESTIRTRLTRARQSLKEILKGDYDYV